MMADTHERPGTVQLGLRSPSGVKYKLMKLAQERKKRGEKSSDSQEHGDFFDFQASICPYLSQTLFIICL
jgi:hypothetical protein